MMRRSASTAALAALLVAAPVGAQPLMLSATVKIAQDAVPGLTAKDAEIAEAIRKQVAAIGNGQSGKGQSGQNLAADSRIGLLLSDDGNGGIAAVPVPTASAGEFGIDPGLLVKLGSKSAAGLQIEIAALLGPKGSDWVRISEAVQSINPVTAPDTDAPQILPAYKLAMEHNGWKKTPTTPPGPCSARQKKFVGLGIEAAINNGDIYAYRDEPERADWIAAIDGFQADCLAPVPLVGPDAALLPLDRLAVLSSAAGVPFCMALHLGGTRFVTARHCFFDRDGIPLPTSGATLAIVGGGDAQKLVEVVGNEPYMLPNGFTSARDIVVIRVPTLAKSIVDRPGQTRFTAAAVALAGTEALAIGYFPLAKPDSAIASKPNARGTPVPWSEALRMTRREGNGYCRVWDASASATDGSRCIEHSCQTTGGFSGTPIFINLGTAQSPVWSVVGLNVARADNKSAQCGTFGNAKDGLMRLDGAIAAAVPAKLYSPQIAATHP